MTFETRIQSRDGDLNSGTRKLKIKNCMRKSVWTHGTLPVGLAFRYLPFSILDLPNTFL